MKFGKPNGFSFIVKNDTITNLEINKLIVGCGSCTKASTSKVLLKPNEETTIDVVFTPGSTGPQKKHVTVNYDNNQALRLEFTAEVYA